MNKYGEDLVEKARNQKLDPVIGRDEEIRNIIRILSRKTKNNPVLIGEPGVGKTAAIEGLAQRIVAEDVPEGLKDKKIFALDMGALVAGAKYRGEFEERLKAVLEEVKKSDGQMSIELERTDDILKFLGEHKRAGQFLCGFSMETRDMLRNSRAKLEKKNLDMVAANNLKVEGAGFQGDTNVLTLITQDEEVSLPLMSKEDAALKILDKILLLTTKAEA